MAIYYNNDAKLLMDIKPSAVPFAGEDIIVPILTAMTAGERESCVNGFVDIMGMNERHKERNGELYHAIRNWEGDEPSLLAAVFARGNGRAVSAFCRDTGEKKR